MRTIYFIIVIALIFGCLEKEEISPQVGNKITTTQEITTTTTTFQQETIEELPETTASPTTEIETTTTTLFSVASCVEAAGFGSNRMIYTYTNVCGNKWTDEIKTNSRRVGKEAMLLNVGLLKEKETNLLSCFYRGDASSGNYGMCPMLYCPKNGNRKEVVGNFPIAKQVREFALEC
ncbi:MAG: hypothetical protein KKD39_07745 [Candidatus Altiarchaeota archaeon]|nr:hypothetical protein [Candidatus Altiarchaeota archaeon]